MVESEFRLDGIEELQAKLKAVPHEISYKGGRFALRRASMVVAKEAQNNARRIDDLKTAEKIYKNITVRWSSRYFKATGNLRFRVGVLGGARIPEHLRKRRRRPAGQQTLERLGEIEGKGKRNPGGDTFYWRFIEFGTMRYSGTPFLRPALPSKQDEATREFVNQAKKAIDRAIKKANKK